MTQINLVTWKKLCPTCEFTLKKIQCTYIGWLELSVLTTIKCHYNFFDIFIIPHFKFVAMKANYRHHLRFYKQVATWWQLHFS
jgi:hypothetical protein